MKKYINFSREDLIKVIDQKNHMIYSLNGKVHYFKHKLKGTKMKKLLITLLLLFVIQPTTFAGQFKSFGNYTINKNTVTFVSKVGKCNSDNFICEVVINTYNSQLPFKFKNEIERNNYYNKIVSWLNEK